MGDECLSVAVDEWSLCKCEHCYNGMVLSSEFTLSSHSGVSLPLCTQKRAFRLLHTPDCKQCFSPPIRDRQRLHHLLSLCQQYSYLLQNPRQHMRDHPHHRCNFLHIPIAVTLIQMRWKTTRTGGVRFLQNHLLPFSVSPVWDHFQNNSCI